jgi:hypothetical protein
VTESLPSSAAERRQRNTKSFQFSTAAANICQRV